MLVFSIFRKSKIQKVTFRSLKLKWNMHYDECICKSIAFQSFSCLTILPKMDVTSCKLVNISHRSSIVTYLVTLFLSPNFKGWVTNFSMEHFIMTSHLVKIKENSNSQLLITPPTIKHKSIVSLWKLFVNINGHNE